MHKIDLSEAAAPPVSARSPNHQHRIRYGGQLGPLAISQSPLLKICLAKTKNSLQNNELVVFGCNCSSNAQYQQDTG
jgi:hypothetical protein